jgi:zinc protease
MHTIPYPLNSCGPENVEKLTRALLDIIKDAQEKGVEQKDLDKVKETWKKQYHVNLQSNDWWLSGLSNAWIDQTNAEGLLDYEKRVDAIKLEDLQKAAKKFLTLNNMVKAVLYPESSNITPGVKTVKPF